MSYYELELRIQWTDPGKYVIAGRCINPDQDSETELIDREAIAIDEAALRAVANDPMAYGAALSQMVFGSAAPYACLLYTSPSPRDLSTSRMPSSA